MRKVSNNQLKIFNKENLNPNDFSREKPITNRMIRSKAVEDFTQIDEYEASYEHDLDTKHLDTELEH